MGSTARAYEPRRSYDDRQGRQQQRRPQVEPRIESRPGQRSESEAGVRRAMSAFKVGIVVLAIVAVMCVARVWLFNASMQTLVEVSEVTASIEEIEEENVALQVEYYASSNPSTVKEYASETLGMTAASATTATVDLTPEVLVQAVSSTVTGGIEACENALAEQEAATE